MEIKYILDIVYLIGSVTFVIGLKMLSHPDTARRGNLYAAFGMALAIAGTILLYNHPGGYTSREPLKIILILAAIGIGTVAGWLTANRVQMTKMPELVSLFNGMGGACAALIGIMEYEHNIGKTGALATIIAGMIIGSVSFSGSIIAFLKLNETM
ncbi:MAG TPA: NAD(P)(+) transhydrogenase (Re/Si-specific) subunit beta, partial [Emticicia sp.]